MLKYLFIIIYSFFILSWGFSSENENIEVGPYMGTLQRYSMKLGYAVEGKNLELAAFYMEEIKETLEEIVEKNPMVDSITIANPLKLIMTQKVDSMDTSLKNKDWKKIKHQYESLIHGCNRCHKATEHEFIIITPTSGKSIFNQKFN